LNLFESLLLHVINYLSITCTRSHFLVYYG